MIKISFWIVSIVCNLFLVSNAILASSSFDKPEQSSLSSSGNDLHMTLQGAIYYCLKGNNDIKIASFSPPIAEEQLGKARSVYDPFFLLSGGANREDRPVQSVLDTGELDENSLVEDRWSAKVELRKHVSTGGNLSVFQEVGHLDSNSTFVTPNPQSTSSLTWQITQPLLRGIGDKENKSSIQIAQTNIAVSEEEFQQTVMDVVLEVITTYWQVYFNRESFLLSKESIKMAEEIYRREKVRLKQGISKPLDVDRSIAAIETRRNVLYSAQNDLDNSTSRLKYLMSTPDLSLEDPDVGLIPTEKPRVDVNEINREESLAIALKNRPGIRIENQRLKMAKLKMDLSSHNQLPRLDAKVDYTLSSLDNSEGDALQEVYSSGNDGWSVWLEFGMSLGNNEAISEYRISHLEYNRARENIKKVKEQVITEVYSTIKELGNAAKQIQTAKTALEAREKILVSEEALYQLAQKSNEDLLQSQIYVILSKRESLRAIVNYNRVLAKLARVEGALLGDYHIDVQ
jgi:outer membrane protein TolC